MLTKTTKNPADDELGLPPYSASSPDQDAAAATTGFTPTLSLQIQTPGKPWLSLPVPTRPDPIPVFTRSDILGGSTSHNSSSDPAYVSHRPKRSSGTSYLISSSTTSPAGEHNPVSTTTYRFGPNRPAVVRLFDLTSTVKPFSVSTVDNGKSDEEANNITAQDAAAWDAFELQPRGLLTRAVRFKTRLGTFEWRYASRKERKALSDASTVSSRSASGFLTATQPSLGEVDSLLVLDRIVRVFGAQNGAGSSKKEKEGEEIRTPVARLIRGAATRSPGSGASTAGNGGLLQVDLGRRGGGVWGMVQGEAEEEDGDVKKGGEGMETELEMARVLVVTTAISMLKKEVDRRRAHQIAIMAGASGGP